MAPALQPDDEFLLRRTRRTLADVVRRIGAIGTDAMPAVDRRAVAAMIAELDAELAALRARRDALGQEIAMVTRRMHAAAAYAKSRVAGPTGARRARRRTNDGAGR